MTSLINAGTKPKYPENPVRSYSIKCFYVGLAPCALLCIASFTVWGPLYFDGIDFKNVDGVLKTILLCAYVATTFLMLLVIFFTPFMFMLGLMLYVFTITRYSNTGFYLNMTGVVVWAIVMWVMYWAPDQPCVAKC